jgi:hypothetical protein
MIWIPMTLFMILVVVFSIRMGIKVRQEHPELEGLWPEEKDSDPGEAALTEELYEDLNKIFLETVEGRNSVEILKVYSPRESTVLRALLKDEGIISYESAAKIGSIVSDSFSKSRLIPGQQNSVISVLEQDLAPALSILREYLAHERSRLDKGGQKLIGLASGKIRGFVVPHRILPELLVKDSPVSYGEKALKY